MTHSTSRYDVTNNAAAGDEVLECIAQRVMNSNCGFNMLIRLYREEFLVLMPKLDAKAA